VVVVVGETVVVVDVGGVVVVVDVDELVVVVEVVEVVDVTAELKFSALAKSPRSLCSNWPSIRPIV
jgi:hypothetical protein